MENVINFTDAAVEHIQNMIRNKTAKAFRIDVKKTKRSGLKFLPSVVDEPEPNDIPFVAQHNLQVYIDPEALQYIKGLTFDAVNEMAGKARLVFRFLSIKSECGCGESFSVHEEMV